MSGAQSVQETQVSFDAWVEQHKDDADFARTGHLCWCGHPNLNGPNSKDPRVDRHTIVPTQQAMANSVNGRFMPIGLTNGPEEPLGSPKYRERIDDLNLSTATRLPRHVRRSAAISRD